MQQSAQYETVRMKSLQGEEELVIHMCNVAGQEAVEFFIDGCTTPVVMSKERFIALTQWINGQFEALENFVRLVH